jgi:hypothetical protein
MHIGLGYAQHCQSRWERERRPCKIFVLSIHFFVVMDGGVAL